MLKLLALIFLLIVSCHTFAQVNTQHFKLNCSCKLVNSDWNTESGLNSYEIEFLDGQSILSIGIKDNPSGNESSNKAYLNAISNNGQIPFQQSTFQGFFAIVGEKFMVGYYTRHINYFSTNKMISIVIAAHTEALLKSLSANFAKQFILK